MTAKLLVKHLQVTSIDDTQRTQDPRLLRLQGQGLPPLKHSRSTTSTATCDQLFEILRDGDSGLVSIDSLLKLLKQSGLRTNDPRLKTCCENLKAIKDTNDRSKFNMDLSTFREVTKNNICLINQAFRGEFIIPDWQKFCDEINEIFETIKKSVKHGEVATYIPQLARADQNLWGASICSIDGQRYSVGDVNAPFCMQSCSKPLMYAIALSDNSSEYVHQFVGKEPSGESFNSLVLDQHNQPHNPMINSGAIVTTSLLRPLDNMADRFDYCLNSFRKIAGGEYVNFNNTVFQSERATNDRNLALGYYMRENGCFPTKTDLMETLDLYSQLCSIEATCESVAVMAGTLANGGVNPLTAECVLDPESVRNMLSLMYSCGMYDYSGQFAFHVGLPAKSGVSGAILTVIPNIMGICTFSPPLDSHGNSARGLTFLEELVTRFNFHQYDSLIGNTDKNDPRRRESEHTNVGIYTLLQAAYSGQLSVVKRYHLRGFNMNAIDYDGRTALHLAAVEGHMPVVRFLVENCHADTSMRDRLGSTPLVDAERMGHTAVVDLLRQAAD